AGRLVFGSLRQPLCVIADLSLQRVDVALRVIGGNVKVVQGGTAMLSCYVMDTNDDLTQITWQRRTREKPHNDNFLTILPRDGPQFVSERDDRFKYIGNFNDKNATLQLSNKQLLLPSVFASFHKGLFATCTAAGSKPPAEVRWLTGALGDKVRTTTNSTQYDNGTTTTVSSLFGVPMREINGHQVQCVISGDFLSKFWSLTLKDFSVSVLLLSCCPSLPSLFLFLSNLKKLHSEIHTLCKMLSKLVVGRHICVWSLMVYLHFLQPRPRTTAP
uniref:Ig-like domain-containing protein n=1 Tax=Maylandia zebra TaxID=106582 RepID=A0A3P9B4K1_9CICH